MFKKLLKALVFIFAIPVVYFVVAFLTSSMTAPQIKPLGKTLDGGDKNHTIYLHTNGVHLDIALNVTDINPQLLQDLKQYDDRPYLSFGWGDKNFYLNTPTWGDLTVSTAVTALFLPSDTLMHLTHYQRPQSDWIAVPVSDSQLAKINAYLQASFYTDNQGHKTLVDHQGYEHYDDFYIAHGSYSLFKTCNTWANTGFKQSGLKASLWTPFDFGLLRWYE